MKPETGNIIEETIQLLSGSGNSECDYLPNHEHLLPSIEKLKEIVELIRSIVFPGYFGGPVLRHQSLSVSWRTLLPSVFIRKMSSVPQRVAKKAISLPSGLKVGPQQLRVKLEIFRTLLPSAFMR